MGRNPISHTLTIKDLKEEIPHTLPSLLKTLGGVRRDVGRQNREKVHQLSQKARCSSKAEKGKSPKRSQRTPKCERRTGARALFNEVTSLRGGIPQLRDQPERLMGNCPRTNVQGRTHRVPGDNPLVPLETRSMRKYRGKPVEKDTGGTRKKNTWG